MKLKLLIALVCLPFILVAQTQLSGSLGLNHIKSGSGEVLHYTISPKIGFVTTEKQTVGLQVSYSHLNVDYDNYYGSSNLGVKTLSLAMYNRSRIIGNESICLMVEGSVALSLPINDNKTMYAIGALPVVQFKIAEQLFMDLTIGLMGISYVTAPDLNFSEFNVGVNNSFELGDLATLGIASSAIIPLQFGFTYQF